MGMTVMNGSRDRRRPAPKIVQPGDMTPLFIPLATRWFREFESGAKTTEYRAEGPRWNARTLIPGRRAILAHGYSGRGRIPARISYVELIPRGHAPAEAREIYPDAATIVAIHFEDICR